MEISEARIVFMGTSEISATVLDGLIKNGYQIVGVVAQPDRPVGRKHILEAVPTKKIALEHNIPIFQPEKIRKDFAFMYDLKPDVILTLSYGQILPEALLNIPKLGAINLHGSLLPKYRGAAPIQYAILNGEKETGMTLMKMVKEMDAGEMYAVKEVAISEEDNSSTLFIKMANVALELALEALPKYLKGELKGIPQDEEGVTFAPSIKPEEEKLDLNDTKENLHNKIRALADIPGAYLLLNDEKFKIYKSKIYSNEVVGQVGQIVKADKNGLLLQCKDGLLNLLEIQKQGKKRLDYKSFVNGNQDILNQILK